MNKALFLDRDGVINIDYGHVYKAEDFVFYDGIFDICKKYQDEGYLIFVISNQAGIAKGMYQLEDLEKLDSYMKDVFLKKEIKITNSYYCPHKSEDKCNCRKPEPGLILKAKNDYDIDLENSILIGDKMSDLEAGNKAGIKTLLFKKGKYSEHIVNFNYGYIEY